MLTIDNVKAYHAGLYTCKAKNYASAVNFTAELIVNGIESLNHKFFFSLNILLKTKKKFSFLISIYFKYHPK